MKPHQVRDLTRTLPSVCRALTRQKGIKLVFSGPPRTDGKTIYSNPLPIEATVDQVAIITGDIDHECGHILYTDFEVRKVGLGSVRPERSAFVAGVHNALEDTFIERQLGEDFLGCKSNLAVSAELMEPDIEIVGVDQPAQALTQYLDAWGRVHVLGQKLDKTLAGCEAVAEELLGEDGRIRVDGLLSAHLPAVDSTARSFDLALKIQRLLEDIAKDKPDAAPQGPSDCGHPSGQPQMMLDPPEGGNSSQSEGSDGQDQAAQGAPSPASAGARAALSDPTETRPLVARRQAADAAAQQAAVTSMKDTGDDAGNSGGGAGGGGSLCLRSAPERYHQLLASSGAAIHDLQRKLVSEYQTLARRRQVIADAGRLDGHRLPRAILGDPMIHRSKVKREMPYPAVSLVVDCSGSMSGVKLDTAVQSLIAVAEANRQLGVKTEIIAFGGDARKVVKPFDADLNVTTKGLIGGIFASGGTPTAQALWLAGQRLAARRESRRLLMLITDGVPNSMPEAQQMAGLLDRSGIELYGIGIGTDAVRTLCPRSSFVTHVQDIAPAVLGAIRSRLLHAA